MTEQETTTIQMRVLVDREKRKLYFYEYYWPEWGGTEFCAHGVKSRWMCDDCERFFVHQYAPLK